MPAFVGEKKAAGGGGRTYFYYLLALALGCLLTVLPGCLSISVRDAGDPPPPPPSHEGESFAEFMDVPYPSVMKLESRNTFSYERKGVRAGVVTAVGDLSADEIGAYYDSHLPSYGWTPLAEAQSGKLVSTWTKGKVVLTVITNPLSLSITSDTRLELWVAAPHTREDLGRRVVYDNTGASGKPILETTPIRAPRGSGSNSGGGSYQEEDI
ncbi:MAG: hypothetical protein LBO05_10465 [Deltaproteobacteria bacterium]|jgi:hypothetical protein|nr:hypothetical protein [Deltaproteobacteria bacterium]